MLPQPVKFRYRPLLVEHVIERVVEPAEVVGRTDLAPLGGVVEDDVENDLDPRRVEGVDHLAEFLPGGRPLRVAGVRRLGRAEGDRVVAPEVPQLFAGQRIDERAVVLVELVDRQKLDGRDAQLLEVADLLDQAGVGAGMTHARAGIDREAAHVQLVDDRVFERGARAVDGRRGRSSTRSSSCAAAGCPGRPRGGRTTEPAHAGRCRMMRGS